MTEREREALAGRVNARPAQYVAQEEVDLSTTPVHSHRGLEARHVVLRVIAAWDGTSYAVMPGGLTRVATGQKSLVVSMQLGGGSKDTWVMGRVQRSSSIPRQPAPQASYVSSTELSSRMADNLFWLGRYAERLEATARLTRVLLPGVSGDSEQGRYAPVDTILHFLRGLDLLPPEYRHAAMAKQWWNVQRLLADLVFDPSKSSGVRWNMAQLRRLSWEVKERLSQDTWRVLQQLEGIFAEPPPANHDRRYVAALAALDDIVIMLSAFAGLLAENPTRGYGWRFLAIGRRLHGTKPAIRVKEDNLGLTAARRYTLKLVRDRSTVTCTIARQGTVYGSLDYTLTKPERRAFGSGKKTGIRMRLVARGTRRDEDDGRSVFDTFRVRTLS